MEIARKSNVIYSVAILFLCFPAYPLIAAITPILNVDNSTIALLVRVVTVILCVVNVFLVSRGRVRIVGSTFTLMAIFWIVYLYRILNDTLDPRVDLANDNIYYWTWAVGGCLVPWLSIALVRKDVRETDRLFFWVFWGFFAASVLAAFHASGAVIGEGGLAVETGRLRLTALNPIALGNLGGSLVVLSIWGAIYFGPWAATKYKILPVAGTVVGGYLLVAANSRGPLLSVVACLMFVVLMSRSRFRIYIIAASALLAILFVPLATFLQDTLNISTFYRMLEVSVTDDASSLIRIDIYGNALEEFLSSPIFGAGLEEKISGSYPHNIVLEAFMATGVLFGIVFVVGFILTSKRAFSLFSKYPQYGWPSLLFVQYAVGAMFSGALYNVVYLWAAIGLLISLSWPSQPGRWVSGRALSPQIGLRIG